jgi:predicted Zn-dependent protease
MRTIAGIVLGAGLIGGCTELIEPIPVDPYEYRLFASSGEGNPKPLAFHWPKHELPVKVYVAPGDPLEAPLDLAIQRWQDAFLYGEWQAEIVADSNLADIIVRNQTAPAFLRGNTRMSSNAPQCRGATDYSVNVAAGTLQLPFRIYVWSRIGPDGPGLTECFDITTTHELGHALGIFAHSPNIEDLMFGDPIRTELSARDRATANAAVHHPATLIPISR